MSSKILRNIAQANESLNLRVNDLTVDGTIVNSGLSVFSGMCRRDSAPEAYSGAGALSPVSFNGVTLYDTNGYIASLNTFNLAGGAGDYQIDFQVNFTNGMTDNLVEIQLYNNTLATVEAVAYAPATAMNNGTAHLSFTINSAPPSNTFQLRVTAPHAATINYRTMTVKRI